MTLPYFPNTLVSKIIIILTLPLMYIARESIPGRPDHENYITGCASHESSNRMHKLRCFSRVKTFKLQSICQTAWKFITQESYLGKNYELPLCALLFWLTPTLEKNFWSTFSGYQMQSCPPKPSSLHLASIHTHYSVCQGFSSVWSSDINVRNLTGCLSSL